MTYTLGSFVRLRLPDAPTDQEQIGQVYFCYRPNGFPDADMDLRTVRHLGPNPMRFINDSWYAVLLDQGRSALYLTQMMPASCLEEIEPFELSHPWESLYIPKSYRYESVMRRQAHDRRMAANVADAAAATTIMASNIRVTSTSAGNISSIRDSYGDSYEYGYEPTTITWSEYS